MTAPYESALASVRSVHNGDALRRIAAAVAHLETLECQCRPVAVAGWPHTVGKCDRCQVLELLGGNAPRCVAAAAVERAHDTLDVLTTHLRDPLRFGDPHRASLSPNEVAEVLLTQVRTALTDVVGGEQ